MSQNSVLRTKLPGVRQVRALVAVCLLAGTVVVAHAETAGAVAPVQTKATIATGVWHTLVLKDDGTLWTFGRNNNGQLGTLTNAGGDTPTAPTQVLSGVTAVAAGATHSLALKEDGTLWAFGDNQYGQLGDSAILPLSLNPTPTQVMTGVAAIGANGDFSLVIKDDGSLWTFGRNEFGQLGRTNNLTPNPIPTQVMTGVAAVGAGLYHGLVVKSDGTVWSFGRNNFGQLGYTANAVPNPTPTQVPGLTDFVAAAGGNFNSVALRADGTVFTFGLGFYGQLGDSAATDFLPHSTPVQAAVVGVTAIAARQDHVLAVKADGKLVAWGYNFFGQLTTTTGIDIVQGFPTPAEVQRDVTEVATGNAHTVFLKNDGTLWASGLNDYGQQGDGSSSVASDGTPDQVLAQVLQPSSYSSLDPGRLMDTRSPGSATVDGLFQGIGVRTESSTTALLVSGRAGVPLDADAVTLNVTVTSPAAAGYVTVFPCGSSVPMVSNLNFREDESIPNSVIVKLGPVGTVCFFTSVNANLIVDVQGFYPATSTFVALSPPNRTLDTRVPASIGIRPAGSITPIGGQGVATVFNVTAVAPQADGHLTVYPCGTAPPNTSNVNFVAGQSIPNLVVVKSDGGGVCVFTSAATHLIVDVSGYFPASSTFHSLAPQRLIDSRPTGQTVDAQFQALGLRAAGTTTQLQITGRGGVPTYATSVALNVTVTGAQDGGYVTVYPCGSPLPNASNLNFSAGQTIPNLVISKIGTGGKVCLFTSATTDIIADVNGYFDGAQVAP